jgi:two-component system, OmpR family, sensor histidine kinase TctE
LKSKRVSSLRLQLLAWLLVPLMGLLAINAYYSNEAAVATANEAFDRLLIASADAIAEQVDIQDGALTVDLPYVALQLLESNIQERVFYRVVAPNGDTLTGYEDLPLPANRRWTRDDAALYTANYRGDTIHLVARRKPLYGSAISGAVTVIVAETGESRKALSHRILLEGLARQGLLIVATGILVWFGVGRGLRPLVRLRESLLCRPASDLSPIDASGLQTEVRPLIDALNQHTSQIQRLIEGRQRFLADASHQMRTPVAEMRMQVEYAVRQNQPELAAEALHDMEASLSSLSRMVTQMLSLARSDPSTGQRRPHRLLDLVELAQSTTLDFVTRARKKRITLSFDAGAPVRVMGDPVMLRELVANLIDNAVAYTDEGGAVTVRVHADRKTVLEVEDSGPGIPAEERERVFDRFYRVAGTHAPGSGLGLSIAADICKSHDAAISLLTPASGRGLLVRVEFPRAD